MMFPLARFYTEMCRRLRMLVTSFTQLPATSWSQKITSKSGDLKNCCGERGWLRLSPFCVRWDGRGYRSNCVH
jgi:hypothetical protein